MVLAYINVDRHCLLKKSLALELHNALCYGSKLLLNVKIHLRLDDVCLERRQLTLSILSDYCAIAYSCCLTRVVCGTSISDL